MPEALPPVDVMLAAVERDYVDFHAEARCPQRHGNPLNCASVDSTRVDSADQCKVTPCGTNCPAGTEAAATRL